MASAKWRGGGTCTVLYYLPTHMSSLSVLFFMLKWICCDASSRLLVQVVVISADQMDSHDLVCNATTILNFCTDQEDHFYIVSIQ